MAKVYKNIDISLEKLDTVVGLDEGGLGTTSLTELKNKLDYIGTSDYSKPNGVGKLDNVGKLLVTQQPTIPVPQLSSLDGPNNVNIGSTKTYVITNYSNFYTYTVSVSSGSYTRSGANIVYTPPTTSGEVSITLKIVNSVNSVNSTAVFKINVIAANVPDRPTIIYPANGSVRVDKNVTLESSKFNANGNFTHSSSDWEVATNSNFSTSSIVKTTYNNINDKVVTSVVDLKANTNYYARVRHIGSNGQKSSWSPILSFMTRTNFEVSYQFLTDKHPTNNNEYFGKSLILSESEDVWLAGGPGRKGGNGEVLAHYKNMVGLPSTPLWSLKTNDGIAPTIALANKSEFGYSMAIDSTGTRLIVGAPGTTNSGKSNSGCVYVFRRFGVESNWTIEYVATASDGLANDRFGHSVAISRYGDWFIVGAPYATRSGKQEVGRAYMFSRGNGSTNWQVRSIIASKFNNSYAHFGYSVAISGDGKHIFVGSPGQANDYKGSVIIYRYETSAANEWHYHGILSTDGLTSNAEFGYSICVTNSPEINDTYDMIVVGAPGSNNNRGAAYVYKNIINKNVQTYAIIGKLTSSEEYDERFGESVTAKTDNSRIYVGAPNGRTKHSNGQGATIRSGCVYAYKNVNDEITFIGKIEGNARDNTGRFGESLYMAKNPNSKFLMVGDPGEALSGFSESGIVYIFN